MIKEHDRIILTADLDTEGLKGGDVGTVVHVYPRVDAYEVEFVTLEGRTVTIATLQASQVRPIGHGEIAHARLI